LGVNSKDLDFVCEANSFDEMLDWIEKTHKKIYLSKPEFFTVRALGFDGKQYDYVLARKESAYSDGRRPDSVSPGTILQDLSRRDFSVNAIAFDVKNGSLFDPHGGSKDIDSMTLRCVGSTHDRFAEDPLRILRAMRFCIMKGFKPSQDIKLVFSDRTWASEITETVSDERIREELKRCFHFDTVKTMEFLVRNMHKNYHREIFRNSQEKLNGFLWLDPTSRKK